MTAEEKYYLDSLITNALTVNIDEAEGQQVINLEALNLCAVDYAKSDVTADTDASIDENDFLKSIYEDEDLMKLITTSPDELPNILKDIDTDDRVIIEFAGATVKDPKPVTYSISVKPGETINDDTIIGQVEQEGKLKTIKSIFSKGTVSSINDGEDYFRLYPSNCDRHIVLENTLFGSGNDFNISDNIMEINQKFQDEGLLYALITNNMCYSLLPYVLSHRYRGVYTRKRTQTAAGLQESKWYLDTSDLSYDNTEVSTFIQNKEFQNNKQYDTTLFVFDKQNENLDTGVAIFDSSILMVLDDIQDDFGSKIISPDITKADMKSWKKRAKKKRKRKKVKQEIKQRTEASTDKFKKSPNPYQAIQDESKRLLDARQEYIDKCIELYKTKDKLPLCKYDPDYTDCKFLVNDTIDSNTITNTKKYDSDFSYYAIGDVDNYYNYYFSLLGKLNLLNDESDPYTKEFYQIVTDIINKRLIVEQLDAKDMKQNFMKLFNDNVFVLFKLYDNNKYNTKEHINQQFASFESKVNVFVQNEQKTYSNNIKEKFNGLNLGEEAYDNAGNVYTDNNEYRRIYDYIKSLYTFDKDEDADGPNEIISQLATMYTYIKSYDLSKNPYKDLKDKDDKFIYLTLVNEEAKKITDFWDKIIDLYEQSTMTNCIDALTTLAHKFDDYASWPLPSEININGVNYKHYLFENIYPKEFDDTVDISIGDYSFPEEIEFPEIPEDIDVDENWAIDQMNSHEMGEPDNPNAVSFLDFKYWQKYFALATLICLVPCYWNCGLDILPFIQMIPLPCIFIAIHSVYIPLFNMLIVFGIAIRGMYPWPIILYLNTSNQPINILTPLVAILEQLKNVFYAKLDQIELVPITGLVNMYIDKLNKEINEIKKENIKLDTYKTVIKSMPLPKAESFKEEFARLVDPSIDTRQRITRLETLVRKQRVKK